MRTAGELIVDSLVANGIDRVFCVPGESYLGLLDALYGRTDIDTVVCRHEAGAGFMATRRCAAHRPARRRLREPRPRREQCGDRGAHRPAGRGAVSPDRRPGAGAQRPPRCRSRRSTIGQMYGAIAKWCAEVTDPARMAETMLRAIQAATTGTPGPVVIAVPEDVLTATSTSPPVGPQAAIRAAPAAADVAALRGWLAAAARPLALAGAPRPPRRARGAARLLERWELPAVVSFRSQDLLANAHRLYAGDMGLANPPEQMALLRRADLLLVLGARFTDITSQGYSFPDLVRPQMRLAHVHPDPSAIGTHFAADLAIACDPQEVMAALGEPPAPPPGERARWIDALGAARRKIATPRRFEVNDGVAFEEVAALVGRQLADDAIVTVDAGIFGAPVYRVIPFAPPQRLLGADRRGDGVRRSGGGRGCAARTGAASHLLCRRRRLPDDRKRARRGDGTQASRSRSSFRRTAATPRSGSSRNATTRAARSARPSPIPISR